MGKYKKAKFNHHIGFEDSHDLYEHMQFWKALTGEWTPEIADLIKLGEETGHSFDKASDSSLYIIMDYPEGFPKDFVEQWHGSEKGQVMLTFKNTPKGRRTAYVYLYKMLYEKQIPEGS